MLSIKTKGSGLSQTTGGNWAPSLLAAAWEGSPSPDCQPARGAERAGPGDDVPLQQQARTATLAWAGTVISIYSRGRWDARSNRGQANHSRRPLLAQISIGRSRVERARKAQTNADSAAADEAALSRSLKSTTHTVCLGGHTITTNHGFIETNSNGRCIVNPQFFHKNASLWLRLLLHCIQHQHQH